MNNKQNSLNVVSFDPSLRNWGIAYASYTPSHIEILGAEIIQTKPTKKSALSKAKIDLSDIDILQEGIQESLLDADIVVIELPIGSKSASAMKSYGACMGLISSVQLPRLYVSPYEVKSVIGDRETTKEEIIDWVNLNHPGIIHHTKCRAEHQADAVLAIYAAQKQLRKYYASYFNTSRSSHSN